MRFLVLAAALLLAAPDLASSQNPIPSPDRSAARELSGARTVQALVHRQADVLLSAAPAGVSVVPSTNDSLWGAISGHVIGLQPDATGVFDAMVWAFQVEAEPGDSTGFASVPVKDDGYYFLGGLKAGLYVVAVRASGFNTVFFDQAGSAADAKPVLVEPGSTVTGIDFLLEPWVPGTGVISGRVTEANTGLPVPGAELFAFPADGGWVSSWGRTDGEGSYTVTGLPAGAYFVEARAEGHIAEYFDGARRIQDATAVSVADADTTSDVNFALSTGGRITGRVSDAAGGPLSGIAVYTYVPYRFEDSTGVVTKPGSFAAATTDETGAYLLGGLESGDYVVTAVTSNPFYRAQVYYDGVQTEDQATRIAVTEGDLVAGIDLVLEVPEGFGSISGNVLNEDGSPVQRGLVWIFSDMRGAADSTGVEPGGDGMIEPGSPDDPGPSNFWNVSVQVPLDPDGGFRVTGLPAGSYLLAAELHDREFGFKEWGYWVWYPSSLTQEGAQAVVVVADQETAGITLVVPGFDGVITGTVTNAAGAPLVGATVWMQPESYADATFGYAYTDQVAMTDSSGVYLFDGVPDGRYRLVASACGALECLRRWWPDALVPEEGGVVVVAGGVVEQGPIDFVLPLRQGAGSISGTVARSGGEPLARARVAAYSQSAEGVVWGGLSAVTDDTGQYVLKGLFEGTWVIQAEYFDGDQMGSVWYDGVPDMESATPITLGINEHKEGIDLTLDIRPILGGIRGRVSYDFLDMVIDRGYVEIRPLYEDMAMRPFAPWIIPQGLPIRSGAFEIKGLPEGSYTVSVYVDNAFEVYDNALDLASATPVGVRGGEISEIDMSLSVRDLGPGTIQGRVTDKEGNPLDIAIVEAIPMSAEATARSYPTITAEDGSYALRGLPEGKYLVLARGAYHAAVFYDGVFDPTQATIIPATAEPVEGIDFALPPVYYAYAGDERSAAPGSMSIHGKVTDEDGHAVAGALVYVVDDNGNALGYTRTGTDGSYQVNGLNPAGNVHVQVSMPGYTTQFNGGAVDLGTAENVEWKAGSSEVNFTMAVGQATGTEDPKGPTSFRLLGAYPNPFNPTVNIRFELPDATRVRLSVYDVLGREVASLLDEPLPAGSHTVPFTASQLPSGLYLYRIAAGDGVLTGTVTLMK